MLLKFRSMIAPVVLSLAVLPACADDEEPNEVVQPDSAIEEPVPPDGDSMASFSPETIYFAFDDYTLNMDAQDRLKALADHLSANANSVVQIEGHCDERGSIEYNLALGERRAQSVKNYLVQMGVDSARLSTISYGEEKPASEGHDESAWSSNRRAEFIVTNN